MTTAGFYLAVMPRYRRACMDLVRREHRGEVSVWVSEAHLDRSVTTDPGVPWYQLVRMIRFRRPRAFLQVGRWGSAISQDVTVVDLNPRSVTAWSILGARRLLGRRTLVWGHVYPRAGAGSRTASLRLLMRRIADGTVSYTVTDAVGARTDLPEAPVWVATNALYPRASISPAEGPPAARREVVYVGRFVPAKKVDLLVRAFALAREHDAAMRLTLVGDGELRAELERIVAELGIVQAVTFEGWVDEHDALRDVYRRAFAAVSPGFAGLSLTQAAGFGVPTLVSEDEPHSPEIELAEHGAVRWFPTGSVDGLAGAIVEAWRDRGDLPDRDLSNWVRASYSAESMAAGLLDALSDDVRSAAHENEVRTR